MCLRFPILLAIAQDLDSRNAGDWNQQILCCYNSLMLCTVIFASSICVLLLHQWPLQNKIIHKKWNEKESNTVHNFSQCGTHIPLHNDKKTMNHTHYDSQKANSSSILHFHDTDAESNLSFFHVLFCSNDMI